MSNIGTLPELVSATVQGMETVGSVGVMLSAGERLATRWEYSEEGLYKYSVLRKSYRWMQQGWLAPMCETLLDYEGYMALLVLQSGAAMLLLLHILTNLSMIWLGSIALVTILSQVRNQYESDGADQMQTILFGGLLLCTLSPTVTEKSWCLVFICLHAVVSYIAAGVAKMRSSAWRKGTALISILQTEQFGHQGMVKLMEKLPWASRIVCRITMLFECSLPLFVFMGVGPCLVFIAMGIAFHLATAQIMGLNTFFWSFIATYPAFIFVALVGSPFFSGLLR